jgi:hypothetical protein
LKLNSNEIAARLSGGVFLLVAVISLTGALILTSVIGPGTISGYLLNDSSQLTLLRVVLLADLITSPLIFSLAILLSVVLKKQSNILAIVAKGLWFAEAVFLAVSKLGLFTLLTISGVPADAGATDHSYYRMLGEVLYYGVTGEEYSIHTFFICIGGLLWCYLFYKSRYIPRALSLFGLIALTLSFVGMLVELSGFPVSFYLSLPVLPFEFAIGGWLLVRGVDLHLVHVAQSER